MFRRVVLFVIDAHDEHGCVSRRCRNYDFFGASGMVSLGFIVCGKDAVQEWVVDGDNIDSAFFDGGAKDQTSDAAKTERIVISDEQKT
uniref:Uncharacterized protein n=1 Tax=Romanomermis culicivorax TaxID=13658 RepID=A0A915KD49_ROMCU